MANLFIGFPVARAKIADMISTSAPPSLHKTQHQDGGTDEIDVSGLTGLPSGGLAIGGADYYGSTFEELTGYDISPSGSGDTSVSLSGATLWTGATMNSVAELSKSQSDLFPGLTFSKDRSLIADIKITNATSAVGTHNILSGGAGGFRHIGFKVVAGILYGTVGNGSLETTVALETLGTGAYTIVRSLRAIFAAGVKCEFYVDGSLLGTITTGLPSGYASSSKLFYANATNPGVAEIKTLLIGHYSVQIAQ